jgi:sugar O-acyltransferase (sialic acid O-acetyltransferase NeuD family)
MESLIGVFGSGGFGREVMPLVNERGTSLSLAQASVRTVFVVDEATCAVEVNGYQQMSFDDFCLSQSQSKAIVISVGDGKLRKAIYKRVADRGIPLLSVKAANSVQLQSVQIGEGSILCPYTTLTSNVKIGKCFHANLYSYVAHDCIIGDFVTFAPGVKCNGNIVIEDDVYVGTGAIIKQGKKERPIVIGRGSKIEAGAYVTRSVDPGVTVFGNPAVRLTLSGLRKMRSAE